MKEKRKARPTVDAAGQAKWERHWASGNPHNNFTMEDANTSRLLLRGRKNAIPFRDLRVVTGRNGRTPRRMIVGKRRGSVPILSDNSHVRAARLMCYRTSKIMRTAQAIVAAENLEDMEE